MPPFMTPRERTITALKGGMPDQIPFVRYDDMQLRKLGQRKDVRNA